MWQILPPDVIDKARGDSHTAQIKCEMKESGSFYVFCFDTSYGVGMIKISPALIRLGLVRLLRAMMSAVPTLY